MNTRKYTWEDIKAAFANGDQEYDVEMWYPI